MPNIVLKKTFKITEFSAATGKSLSFHGVIPKACVDEINRVISTALTFTKNANTPQFKMDGFGHFFADMNHTCQKHHEEDVIAVILDVLEKMGWTFRFHYASQSSSNRIAGGSVTVRELFIFQKAP